MPVHRDLPLSGDRFFHLCNDPIKVFVHSYFNLFLIFPEDSRKGK